MSDKTTADLTLERVDRLTLAVADLMESHAAQGRNVSRLLEAQGQQLDRIEASLVDLALHLLQSKRATLGSPEKLMASVDSLDPIFAGIARSNHRIDQMLADIAAKLTP